jgi:hypothetical protein
MRSIAQPTLSALVALGLACGPRAAPSGCREDRARTERLLGHLRTLGDPRVPLASGRFLVCFEGEPGITLEGRVTLDPSWSDRALAARLGHLLVHTRDGVARERPPADGACAGWVASMMARERAAQALEASLRQRLGLSGTPPDEGRDLAGAYRARCAGGR